MTTSLTNSLKTASHALLAIATIATLSACAPIVPIPTLDKFKFDAEVDRRCKIDGGIHVYEQVRIPKEKLDKNGRPTNIRPNESAKPKPGEEFVMVTTASPFSSQGFGQNPSTTGAKISKSLVRLSDNVPVSEYIYYIRGGGFVGHDSGQPGSPSYRCPSSTRWWDELLNNSFIHY